MYVPEDKQIFSVSVTVKVYSYSCLCKQVVWSQYGSDPLLLSLQEPGSGQVGALDIHPHP